ncbi:AMP-binding protein, partial [Streptomyces sp. SID10244]|nr:AMP-binding protein [Streptomyces sp. SID10244]
GGKTLPEVLVDRTLDPAHAALISDAETIDYQEFESRTNRLARTLIRRGVGPDVVVAVGIARSLESVIATWAVIKAGGVYLPIDPTYPDDRIDHMLSDSGAALGLTTTADRVTLGDRDQPHWLVLDDTDLIEATGRESTDVVTDADRLAPVRLDNLAYLIYTSGSTGRPKAVAVNHRGISDLVQALREVSSGPATRVLHVASPSFDASMLEMIWAI